MNRKPHSAETKKKISDSMEKRWADPGYRKSLKKKQKGIRGNSYKEMLAKKNEKE